MINLLGRNFGDWSVLREAGRDTDRRVLWLCRCVCGVERPVNSRNLLQGGSLGCGCSKKGLRLRPYESLYHVLCTEAVRRDIEFRLSYYSFLEFTAQKSCHYCGAHIAWAEFRVAKKGSSYNLDRKDNTRGYTRGNCVVCCTRCNRAKNNHFTYEEWVQIGALIRTWPT